MTPGAAPIDLDELYVGFSRDEELRHVASSGGVVTALLVHFLEQGRIHAAVVSRISSRNSALCALSVPASSRNEIMNGAGSSYIDTPVLQTVKALRTYDGKLAVVALPCQVRAMRGLMKRDEEIRSRIALVIGLFCRGNVTSKFYYDYFKKRGIDPGEVEEVRVRRSHLRGEVLVRCRNGGTRKLSFREMNSYRLAGIHAKKLCFSCSEHLALEADISVGDIFHPDYSSHPIKHSAFICRSGRGQSAMEALAESKGLEYDLFGMEKYLQAFDKLERFSNNLGSRRFAAGILGTALPGGRGEKANPFHALAWLIYLLNRKMSETNRGRRFLYALPSSWVTFTAYVVKALSKL